LSTKICPDLILKDSFCADLWDILGYSLKYQSKEVNYYAIKCLSDFVNESNDKKIKNFYSLNQE